ncbi:MAG: hypothetical protein R2797_04695 [Gelidibacter sp.]
MKNRVHISLVLIVTLIVSFFAYRSFRQIENENYSYQIEREKQQEIIRSKENYNRDVSNEFPVFKFSSTDNDLEKGAKIIKTNVELSYHTFDFGNQLISLKTKHANGYWEISKLKLKKSKIIESISGLRGMEFEVESAYCYQVWVSSIGNIGYEYYDGTTRVFYGIIEISN